MYTSTSGYNYPVSSNLFWYGLAPGQVVTPSKVNYYDTFYSLNPPLEPVDQPSEVAKVSPPAQAYGVDPYLFQVQGWIMNNLNYVILAGIIAFTVYGIYLYKKSKKKKKSAYRR